MKWHKSGQTVSFAWPSIKRICSFLEINFGQYLLNRLEFKIGDDSIWQKKGLIDIRIMFSNYLALCFSGGIELIPWDYCDLCRFLGLAKWIVLICGSCAKDFSSIIINLYGSDTLLNESIYYPQHFRYILTMLVHIMLFIIN